MSQTNPAAAQTDASQQSVPCSSLEATGGFEAFYRDSYREVVKAAMIAGATMAEAEDAASRTFLAMLKRWPVNGTPVMYARRAVVNNFIQDKTRGTARVTQRLVERGHVAREYEEDMRFSYWEDRSR